MLVGNESNSVIRQLINVLYRYGFIREDGSINVDSSILRNYALSCYSKTAVKLA